MLLHAKGNQTLLKSNENSFNTNTQLLFNLYIVRAIFSIKNLIFAILNEQIEANMIDVKIKESDIRKAVEAGMDSFVQVFVTAINRAIDGVLDLEKIQQMHPDQITLLAWSYLHEEVMDGGYVQLIHNGYGAFIFKNPFAVAMRNWGLRDLYTHIRHAKKYYDKYHEQIEQDVTDDDFMALYEQMPEFDHFDDEFVVSEEHWSEMIAAYIDDHIENFAMIEDE